MTTVITGAAIGFIVWFALAGLTMWFDRHDARPWSIPSLALSAVAFSLFGAAIGWLVS